MTALLGRKGVVIYENDLHKYMTTDKYLSLKRTFTKTISLGFNQFRTVTIVTTEKVNNKKLLIFPRFLAFKLLEKGYFEKIVNTLQIGEAIDITSYMCKPYQFQIVTADYIIKNIFNKPNTGNAGVICELEAGLGKTFLASIIIEKLKQKTIYVVPNEYLLLQAYKDLKLCFPEMKIGKYYSDCKTDGDIVLMIINSVLSKSFKVKSEGKFIEIPSTEYFKRFGLSIWDEIQDYCTDARSKAFRLVNTYYMLGITAEANSRSDKIDFLAHYNCGPVLQADTIENFEKEDDKKFTGDVLIVKYDGPAEYTQKLIEESTGMMSCSKMSRQIIQDPYRLQLICDHVLRLYREGKNTFVWCDMRELVYVLVNILSVYELDGLIAEEDDCARLMGGVTNDDIVKAQNARILVATYQYAYKGVSLPKFNSMVCATSRRSKTYQTLKRIFRISGDATIRREIIDIVDVRTNLKNQLPDRMKQYTSDAFDLSVETVKIKYDTIDVSKNMSLFKYILNKYINWNILIDKKDLKYEDNVLAIKELQQIKMLTDDVEIAFELLADARNKLDFSPIELIIF